MVAMVSSEENDKYPTGGSCNEVLLDMTLGPDGVNHPSLLDVMPVVVEEGSVPIAEKCSNNRFHGLVDHEIPMSSVKGNASPVGTPQLALLSFLEIPVPSKSQMSFDHPANKQNFIDLQVGGADAYSSCIVDIDIGIDNFGKAKPEDEVFGAAKSEGIVTGVLQRQSSMKACGKFMEIVTNHSSPLLNLISRDKSFNERTHDTPNNRWRKYKRTASFDSRKIVLFFSILSSIGTLILIYLTLRVRQAADNFVNA